MKHTILLCFCLWIFSAVQAQDSTYTLSENQFLRMVQLYHPVARQARIGVEQREAEKLRARAAFDPVLNANQGAKTLSSTEYYRYQAWELDIPTWYGITVEAGQEKFNGDRLSNERTEGNLSYAGISFSVLQNLILDKRRAYLKQASILIKQSEAEQQQILNDLLYDALLQYWQWAQAYAEWQVVLDGVKNAEQRFNFTRRQVRIGERAAIDSVEALTQWQYFQQQALEANMKREQARWQLSAYLWLSNQEPYLLPEQTQPLWPTTTPVQTVDTLSNQENYIQAVLNNHPELNAYQQKLKYIQISRQLAFQSLLPKLDVQYRFLNKSMPDVLNNTIPLLNNNFQYGVKFNMPLRLSEGRADMRLTALKQEQTRLDIYNKQNSLINKVRYNYIGVQQLAKQWEIQTELLSNQQRLQSGEETRFQQGESSLFLVNSREQKTIETRQKLVALQAKFFQQKVGLLWSAGMLPIQ